MKSRGKCPVCNSKTSQLYFSFSGIQCRKCSQFFADFTLGYITEDTILHSINCNIETGIQLCKKCKYLKCLLNGMDPYLVNIEKFQQELKHLEHLENVEEFFENLANSGKSLNQNGTEIGKSKETNDFDEMEKFFDGNAEEFAQD